MLFLLSFYANILIFSQETYAISSSRDSAPKKTEEKKIKNQFYPDILEITENEETTESPATTEINPTSKPSKTHGNRQAMTIIIPVVSVMVAVILVSLILKCRKQALDRIRVNQQNDPEITPALHNESFDDDDDEHTNEVNDIDAKYNDESSVQYPSQNPYEDNAVVSEEVFPLNIQNKEENPYENVSSDQMF